MIYPTIADLMKKTGSRYGLVIAASKRARQISEEGENSGHPIDGAKSITQASHEIADGVVTIIPPKKEQIEAEEAAIVEEIRRAGEAEATAGLRMRQREEEQQQ